MTLVNLHIDRDELGGGRIRDEIHVKRIAYREGGVLKRSVHDWQDGDASFPHVVTRAPMLVYTAADGMRRICPTREPQRYIEIGAPYLKIGGVWQKVSLGKPSRSGNRLRWTTAQAYTDVVMGGHFIDLSIEFRGGWTPPGNQIAFPVGMNGLTRDGLVFSRDGVPVLSLRPFVMRDAADPMAATRPVTTQLVQVSGQWYALATLPSLAGMARPVLDPQLVSQPDAADGMDTEIISNAGVLDTRNWGARTDITSGLEADIYYARPLIKFDLSGLPASAIITSAILSLYCITDAATIASVKSVYRQKRAWLEGTRDNVEDNPPTGATWIRYDLTNNWAAPGGFHADDCEQTSIGSRAFTSTETLNEFKDWSLTPTTKAALDLGNGWMIKTEVEAINNAYIFASSDHATAAIRPKLVIDYTLPGGLLQLLLQDGEYHGGLLA